MYNNLGDLMRLRNIKDASHIINKSRYVIKNYNNDFKNNHRIEIEIGMGKGDFLITKALQNPHINFIGIEKYASVLVSVIKKLEDIEIPNLRIMNIDAINIDDYFNNNISKIYINFADPWPKKRHYKRRLTSNVFLPKYAKVFKDDHIIELKTDNRILFEYSLVNLSQKDYQLDVVKLDLYSDLDEDNIATEYEKKFVAKGIPIYKLVARHTIDNKNRK